MLKHFSFILSPKPRTFKMAGINLDSGERTREYEEFPNQALIDNVLAFRHSCSTRMEIPNHITPEINYFTLSCGYPLQNGCARYENIVCKTSKTRFINYQPQGVGQNNIPS